MAKKVQIKAPKFSIVVPILNMERYLVETLDSIFSQSYKDFEVIIQDGGSTDNSIKIIKGYVKKYPRKIKWVSEIDKGQTDAINKGLKKAKGDIFVYINGDDLFHKDALRWIAEKFQAYPESLWFTGYGDIIDENGLRISNWVSRYKNFLIKRNNRSLLLCVNYLTQPATFISKKAYKKYGPFTGVGKIVLEYGLWLKLAKFEMPVVILETLASFRITEDSFSASSFKTILKADQQLVNKETKNGLIILIHWLNNFGRIALIRMQK